MNVLLVYPQYAETFWSMKHALGFSLMKKAHQPPLGLLTVASLLPPDWQKKLVDMNLSALKEKDLRWADLVFISAMSAQRPSVEKVIARCRKAGVPIVAGGPLFTASSDEFDDIDHLVLNEAEVTLPAFLEDLRAGRAGHIYRSDRWADLRNTPAPRWDLIDFRRYASMNVQYSRGCPFDCEFCDIGFLYGRRLRTKTEGQIIAELEALYARGWRGPVFLADDNFIGNKRRLKNDILPAIVDWAKARDFPFKFTTQASVDLADHEDLMRLMIQAGFRNVFVGIETPNDESLAECNKHANRNRDLVASVRKMQDLGLLVQGGFIVGFDSDPPSIFERQIQFIQDSGIIIAMVGLLNAIRGTRLYERLKKERRLLKRCSGDNTDCSTNFIPRMNHRTLVDGYKRILRTIYSPERYYERVATFLRNHKPMPGLQRFRFEYLVAFLKSIVILGMIEKGRTYYWKLLLATLFRRPRLLPRAIVLSIYGFHFRKVLDAR